MSAQAASRPLRVAVIGNYPPDRQESMRRYGALVCELLSASDIVPRYHTPPAVLGRLTRRGALAKWLGYVDKFVIFPLIVAQIAARADLVHICDHSNALYCRFVRGVPVLVTCHDLLAVRAAAGEFAEWRPGRTGRLLQRLIRSSLRHADHILCVSEATRRDVEQIVGAVPATVIMNPLHHPYAPMPADEVETELARAGLPTGRYFLHVGGEVWYKNRAGAVTLFAALARGENYREHRLVFAGEALSPSLQATIERLGLRGRVVSCVGPDNRLLNALYSGAEALLFPSLQEGFGWPIVEAQAADCAVVTSDRAPMRDVAGPDGAVLVDPEDAEAGAAAVLAARHELDRYREKGRHNVARLDRGEVAARYQSLVRSLAMKVAA